MPPPEVRKRSFLVRGGGLVLLLAPAVWVGIARGAPGAQSVAPADAGQVLENFDAKGTPHSSSAQGTEAR